MRTQLLTRSVLAWCALTGAMAVLFLFGAIVQLNDPDPLGWFTLYLAAAASSLLATVRRRAWMLAAPTGIAALVWAITLRASMTTELAPLRSLFDAFEMKSVVIEETREVLGLVIIALWMLGVSALSRPEPAERPTK